MTAVLVLDCGATNVKACLVGTTGQILSSQAMPNETIPDPNYPGGLIWDIDSIWEKLSICSKKACEIAGNTEIEAVTVTTFGVDGAAMKKDGTLCYPVISWQCQRTEKIEKAIGKYIDPKILYSITGLRSYHFNTINKLIWLKENRPETWKETDYYVMLPSIILHRITGEFVTDTTMAGTSMLTDLRTRNFSDIVLGALGTDRAIFPNITEPGTIIGKATIEASQALGIRKGTPVVAAGHDTQFAILGSGAGINQPVLSSGTWEILMARANSSKLSLPPYNSEITIELDAEAGLIDVGVQWIASGALEWISRLFYPGIDQSSMLYSTMIREASAIPSGSEGVTVLPELFPGGFLGSEGIIRGLTHETTRAHIYRASLEALSYYTRYGLEKLQSVGGFSVKDILCVGGGSKNQLWNQIRSDVLGIPVKSVEMKETTALGAALVAFTATGLFKSLSEASKNLAPAFSLYEPGPHSNQYDQLFNHYLSVNNRNYKN